MTAAEDFVLRLGQAFHRYGHPAHRMEDALGIVSQRLGVTGQFFSTPTALFASLGEPSAQRTILMRVEPGSVQLQVLARLDRLAEDVAAGLVSPDEGVRMLAKLEAAPPPYGPALTTVAFALASGSAASFFGGGRWEIIAASAVGLTIGLLALLTQRVPGLGRVFEPVASVAAAVVAALFAHAAPTSIYVATAAGLIVLIPGFAVTVSMMELATRNLVSGTTRLAGAAGTFLMMAFGVALGSEVMTRLLGAAPEVTPVPLPGWAQAASLILASLAFVVLLRAEARSAGAIVAAGVIAYGAGRGGALLLGPELGAFVGALAVGLASNAWARYRNTSDIVTLVPGILLLVPGSIGFRSLAWLIERQTLSGMEAAFRMTLVAIALSAGLLFSSVILPPRRRT